MVFHIMRLCPSLEVNDTIAPSSLKGETGCFVCNKEASYSLVNRGFHGQPGHWGTSNFRAVTRSEEAAEWYRCALKDDRNIHWDPKDKSSIHRRTSGASAVSFHMVVESWVSQLESSRYSSFSSSYSGWPGVHGDRRPAHSAQDRGHLTHQHQKHRPAR